MARFFSIAVHGNNDVRWRRARHIPGEISAAYSEDRLAVATGSVRKLEQVLLETPSPQRLKPH